MQTPDRSRRKGRTKLSLLKAQPARKNADPGKPLRNDALPFKQALDLLEQSIPAAHGVVVTTLPRGSLQIAQPARLPEALLKGYTREYHLEDRLSWQTILGGKPVAGSNVLRENDRFVSGLLRENGLAFAAAAPLAAPVLDGYPGALVVLRTAEQGDFNAEEVRQLGEVAQQIDEIIASSRASRRSESDESSVTLTPRPTGRVFIFDAKGAQLVPGDDFQMLDARLRDGMAEHTRTRLNRLNGELVTADRVQLADSRGDLWTFRAVTYSRYPAVGDGPFVVFAMQPTCSEWSTVRPSDMQADQEMARLIPALKFMRQEFHRGPTLGEIAKQVHLSPFHFHRRFAELLGLTPKHYLLECQITEAKLQLLARKKELAQIATDCGFAHQSHFTSRFKQATGLTPTRWRRLASENRE
ncbi:MAG: AraC family transcriptional regulator [Phycisphaerales bacterium]|nr:AraC family transcriptional regulator [Phycisphaerales bacterium]